MKNVLVIDVDTDRKDPGHIIIGKLPSKPLEGWNGDPMVADFASLLEAVCVIMRLMEKDGIQDSATSLRNAINHLENGFSDAELNVFNQKKDDPKTTTRD